MLHYRRRLPHWIPESSILFITWRLAGSLPAPRADLPMPQHGAPVPFVQQDERLARSSSGPFWLRDPRVASMLQQALRYGEMSHNLYFPHAWVIMPNHVHVILEPRLALPWVRTTKELNELIRYVENNPVQAGLVADEAQWPWSSARMRADDILPEADDKLRSSAPREPLQT